MSHALNVKLESAAVSLRYVFMAASFAVFFGYHLGMMYFNNSFLTIYYLAGLGNLEVIFGTSSLGMLLGVFIGGYLAYGSGRKTSIVSSAALGTMAITASFFAPNLSLMLCIQFVIGFSYGLFQLSTALYAVEITLPGNRGLAASSIYAATFLGALIAIFVKANPASDENFLILLFFWLFNFVMMVLVVIKLPESPRYLAVSGMPDSALPILFRLRLDMGLAARELAGINECCRQQGRGSVLFLQNSNFRRLIWFLLAVTLLMNFSGFFIIPSSLMDLVYASEHDLSFDYYEYSSGLRRAGIIVGLAGIIIAALSLDRFGRRATIILGLAIAALSLLMLWIGLLSWSGFPIIIVSVFILFFIFAVSLIYPSLVCVMAPELMPTRAREFGVAIIFSFNIIINLGCQQFFVTLINAIEFSSFFILCLLSCLVLLVWAFLTIPDSANSSLESIESRLLAGKKISELGMRRGL